MLSMAGPHRRSQVRPLSKTCLDFMSLQCPSLTGGIAMLLHDQHLQLCDAITGQTLRVHSAYHENGKKHES